MTGKMSLIMRRGFCRSGSLIRHAIWGGRPENRSRGIGDYCWTMTLAPTATRS
jgi:hypothetical protein